MAHVDHVNYPCDTYNTHTPNLQYMGVEIVGTRLVGTYRKPVHVYCSPCHKVQHHQRAFRRGISIPAA